MCKRCARSYARSSSGRRKRCPVMSSNGPFPEGWSIPATPGGAAGCRGVVERNADWAVTWLHSYLSADGKTAFCIYEAPTPEAIRKAAAQNRLPVDRIVRVRVLDPFFDG